MAGKGEGLYCLKYVEILHALIWLRCDSFKVNG